MRPPPIPDYGYQRFGDIIDELAGKLTAHLAHEESDGLPLIDASLTPQDWQRRACRRGLGRQPGTQDPQWQSRPGRGRDPPPCHRLLLLAGRVRPLPHR